MEVQLRTLVFLHPMLSSGREDALSLPYVFHPMICDRFLITFGKFSRSFCHVLLHYFYVNLLLYSLCAVYLHLALDYRAVVFSNRFVALCAFIF